MGTFRKFLFILYSRRPRDRLLANQEKIRIFDQKILSYSATVKKKIALGNRLGFQAQIEDLPLKCGIEKENPNNNIDVLLIFPRFCKSQGISKD